MNLTGDVVTIRKAFSDKAGLLHAIQQEPFEATARLVYADWLQENNDTFEETFQRTLAEVTPQLTPDQVKTILRSHAHSEPVDPPAPHQHALRVQPYADLHGPFFIFWGAEKDAHVTPYISLQVDRPNHPAPDKFPIRSPSAFHDIRKEIRLWLGL